MVRVGTRRGHCFEKVALWARRDVPMPSRSEGRSIQAPSPKAVKGTTNQYTARSALSSHPTCDKEPGESWQLRELTVQGTCMPRRRVRRLGTPAPSAQGSMKRRPKILRKKTISTGGTRTETWRTRAVSDAKKAAADIIQIAPRTGAGILEHAQARSDIAAHPFESQQNEVFYLSGRRLARALARTRLVGKGNLRGILLERH
jgi:hypothetical protein